MRKSITMLFLLAALLAASLSMAQAHDVKLNWKPSTDGAVNPSGGYNVQRATAAGQEGSTNINSVLVAVACTDTTSCTYDDTSLAVVAGATLYYTVTFQVGSAVSVKSNEAQATIPVASPTNLTAVGN